MHSTRKFNLGTVHFKKSVAAHVHFPLKRLLMFLNGLEKSQPALNHNIFIRPNNEWKLKQLEINVGRFLEMHNVVRVRLPSVRIQKCMQTTRRLQENNRIPQRARIVKANCC